MGVVLDFGTSVLDGATALPVSFAGGVSSVLSFVARSDAPGMGRTVRNPLRVYSDRIRVGTSEAACLEAEWGASIDDVGLVDDTGVTLYIQFRRLPGDGSVALTDSLGMVSTGFVVLTNTARGVAVSYGTGSAAQLAPASAHGRSVSIGAAAAEAVVPPAIGGGVSVSYGSAAAAQIAPAVAHGISVSIGLGLGAQLAPASAHGTSVSKGVAAGDIASQADPRTGTLYFPYSPGEMTAAVGGSETWDGRSGVPVAAASLQMRVEDSTGAVLKDWTTFASVPFDTHNQVVSGSYSFPAYTGTTGVRVKVRLLPSSGSTVYYGNVETAYATIASGPYAQTPCTVYFSADNYYDELDDDNYIILRWGSSLRPSRIVFGA